MKRLLGIFISSSLKMVLQMLLSNNYAQQDSTLHLSDPLRHRMSYVCKLFVFINSQTLNRVQMYIKNTSINLSKEFQKEQIKG